MKISKRISDELTDHFSNAEKLCKHNTGGGFLTALTVQAIGNAMCQPDVPLTLSFGHPITPRKLMTLIRSRLRIMCISYVECKVVDNQVVLEYKPWKEEFLTAEDAPQVKAVFQVRGEPWSERAIKPLVIFDEMSKYHNEPNAAVAAIAYAIDDDDCKVFLQLWNTGEFDALRKEWDDIPEAVFIGADPLHKVKGVDRVELDLSHPSDPLRLACDMGDGMCIEFANDDNTEYLSVEIAPEDAEECAVASVILDEGDELALREYLNRRAGTTGQTIEEDEYNG